MIMISLTHPSGIFNAYAYLCYSIIMDKIAIISDVHGNLEALNTVLDDITRRGIQRIYCLGDIVSKGAHQQKCIEILRKKCEILVRGNCDESFPDAAGLATYSDYDQKHIRWNQSQLNEDAIDFVKNLPVCYEFYFSGRLVRLLHAHPESSTKSIGNVDKLEHYYELFLPSRRTVSDKIADILIYGHIHIPYAQKLYNRLILNPGSVGDAFDGIRNPEKDADSRFTTTANYLILSGKLDSKDPNTALSYEFVSLPYNIEKELADNKDNIELESYSRELREGIYRDATHSVHDLYLSRGIDPEKV